MNQNKMIVLDYEAGHVHIIDCIGDFHEGVFEDFVEKNGLKLNECHYMTWNGKVTIW
jgi:hypothetical protein